MTKKQATAVAVAAALLGVLAGSQYETPTAIETVADRVATNVGTNVELLPRVIEIDQFDDAGKATGLKELVPNPLFNKRRHATGRVWSKDGDDWEVVWRRKGIRASEIVIGTGTTVCEEDERGPVYIRIRAEPNTNEPKAPIREVLGP